MTSSMLKTVLGELGSSPTILSDKCVSDIKERFPVPREYHIRWANVNLSARPSGIVIADEAIIIKADQQTVKKYNKSCKKENRQSSIYHLIKWEYFNSRDFQLKFSGSGTIISYCGSEVLYTTASDTPRFFKLYSSELERLEKAATISSASVFSDFESVIPANFAEVNTKTGHGEMAEEALTLLDKLEGKQAEVIGRTNIKNGADRIVNGVQIQTKYCQSGQKCINDCFDKATGLFRYFKADGSPMQIEVPADQNIFEAAVKTFQAKIEEGKVPGVTNPEDATKYVRQGKLTYQQALNLCKPGTIESLGYDAATGFVSCSFALGISFLSTYVICYSQTGDKKKALNAALSAGLQVFGLSFLGHMLASQIARTSLTKQLIPISTYLVESLGFKARQHIVNSIRALSGKSAISGAAATKQLAKILRSNAVTSVITFAVFSIPDTYNMFQRQMYGAQYVKNMTSLIGAMIGGGGGTLGTSMLVAKYGAAGGTAINPGVGTALGLVGGVAGGLVVGTGVKMLGDRIREDDSLILSRMFNGVVLNLTYDYMLQESEINLLISKFDAIKPAEFKKLFKRTIAADKQEEVIDQFTRHYFNEIINDRPAIAAPTAEDIVELLKQFDSANFKNVSDETSESELVEEKMHNQFKEIFGLEPGEWRQAISDLQKENILKTICKGEVQEDDIVWLWDTSSDASGTTGIVLTNLYLICNDNCSVCEMYSDIRKIERKYRMHGDVRYYFTIWRKDGRTVNYEAKGGPSVLRLIRFIEAMID